MTHTDQLARVAEFIDRQRNLLIVTGAGCSTESGIPAYRDAAGRWQARRPIQHQEFIDSHSTRQRYWARSLVGFRQMYDAEPNASHNVLAQWEKAGRLELLVTQNVDGLHRKAGSQRLEELHGSLESVKCLNCGAGLARAAVQDQLEALNPVFCEALLSAQTEARPDGDAELFGLDYHRLRLAECPRCAGVLMPNVVFYGGNVPRARVQRIAEAVGRASGLLVVGSTVAVFSSFRICRQAAELGIPIAILNRGKTRADDLAAVKVEAECGGFLSQLQEQWLSGSRAVLPP